jgi:hypothetical protein
MSVAGLVVGIIVVGKLLFWGLVGIGIFCD